MLHEDGELEEATGNRRLERSLPPVLCAARSRQEALGRASEIFQPQAGSRAEAPLDYIGIILVAAHCHSGILGPRRSLVVITRHGEGEESQDEED